MVTLYHWQELIPGEERKKLMSLAICQSRTERLQDDGIGNGLEVMAAIPTHIHGYTILLGRVWLP